MILNYENIIDSAANKSVEVIPFDRKQVQGASLDLRIGPQGATTTHKQIIDIDEVGFMILEPGDMAIISSLEILKLDNSHLARIGLRSKYARKGLHVTTGLQVDPGFSGRIFVGATNLTPKPITLPYKDDFLSIEIYRLNQPTSKPYNGPYQDKMELSAEDIEHIMDGKSYALSEVISGLQSLSANVGKLAEDFHSQAAQQRFLKWAVSIGFGVLAIMISIVALLVAVK